MYDRFSEEWLQAVKRGDTEKERTYSDFMEICELCLVAYEAEDLINSQNWKLTMR